ncbi:farnesol dehydrogenase-like [Daktulosphaira vitifoliae]|uniref:farnesol dehydrogenase-like n=1 Tax=Daktulosphaira vitifoliae TaxID=58002 RepID=UPI0021A9D1F5|nr:farnesol dehydrogenase-like [Daktulosphaira vitifoliae]
MEQWKGCNAIVTGAASGIGAATTIKLIKNGINVIALDLNLEKLKELECFIKSNLDIQKYGIIHSKKCDITDELAVKNIFSWIDSTLGGVSILINNAGIIMQTSLLDGKLSDWELFMKINVLAQCVCSREAFQSMSKNNTNGHIVQINSITGHNITPYFGHKMYNATKRAITTLCEGLRHEINLVNSKIKISSISPGSVNTDLFKTANFKPSDQIKNKVPIQPLDPKDIADAIITVLSTSPNVQIAELIIIPTGSTIQPHCAPSLNKEL